MYPIKSIFFAVLAFSAVHFSIYAAEPKASMTSPATASDRWVPVDDADWAIYMDAPSFHFALAREYLQKGEYAKASSELNMGNSFLIFQAHRLATASKQIEALASGLVKGKDRGLDRFDAVTANVSKVIDNKYAMIPLEIGVSSVFESGYKYHADRAKSKLFENDLAGSAAEIKKAGSFLKLWAIHTGNSGKTELDDLETELNTMASNVESGVLKDKKELDKAFQKAVHIFSIQKK